MRMPSFTAEASLYDRGERYRRVVGRAMASSRQDVVPQYEVVFTTDDDCWDLDCFYDDKTDEWLYCDLYGPYC
jgi:hypothetical protein